MALPPMPPHKTWGLLPKGQKQPDPRRQIRQNQEEEEDMPLHSAGRLPRGVRKPTDMSKFLKYLPGSLIMPPIHLDRIDCQAWYGSILHRDPDGDYEFKVTFPRSAAVHGCYATVKIKEGFAQWDQIEAYEDREEQVHTARSTLTDTVPADLRLGFSKLSLNQSKGTICAVYIQEIIARDPVKGRWCRKMLVDLGKASYWGLIWVPYKMHARLVHDEMKRRRLRVVYFYESFCDRKSGTPMVDCYVRTVIYGYKRSQRIIATHSLKLLERALRARVVRKRRELQTKYEQSKENKKRKAEDDDDDGSTTGNKKSKTTVSGLDEDSNLSGRITDEESQANNEPPTDSKPFPETNETSKEKTKWKTHSDFSERVRELDDNWSKKMNELKQSKEGKGPREDKKRRPKPQVKLKQTTKKQKTNNGAAEKKEEEESAASDGWMDDASHCPFESIEVGVEPPPLALNAKFDVVVDVLIKQVRHMPKQNWAHQIAFRVDVDGEEDVMFVGQVPGGGRWSSFTKR